jgi:hypothetical protein
MRATYSKAEKEKAQPRLRKAAADTLAWGQKNGIPIHIFGAPYKKKVGQIGTHGSRDAAALSCANPDHIQCRKHTDPLSPFVKPLTPCIRLDYSGLTAVDVDHGLEGLNDEEALAKAEANGLPRTLVIRSGRPGGMIFVYRGVRTIPDSITYQPRKNGEPVGEKIAGFQVGDLSGDIKCRGHICCPGAIHENGAQYKVICDALTDLPKFWATYTRQSTQKSEPITYPEQAARVNEYAEKFRADLISGKRKLIPEGELIRAGRRFGFLTRKAGGLRKQQWEPEMIRHALDILAVRKCEDGLNYIRERADALDRIAGWSRSWGEGDYVTSRISNEGQETTIIRIKTRAERQTEVIAALPNAILSHEIYERMAKALRGTPYMFNPSKPSPKHRDRLCKELRSAGYENGRDNGGRSWWFRAGHRPW